MGGWAAATNMLNYHSVLLFLVLFAWQHPHFYALAIMYKDDYAKGKLKMLPVLDPSGIRTKIQIMLYTAIMLLASVYPFYLVCLDGFTCLVYFLLVFFLCFYFSIKAFKTLQYSECQRSCFFLVLSICQFGLF